MEILSKNELKLFRSLSSRHGRRKSDLCVCEGVKACSELYAHRPDLIVKAFFSGALDEGLFPNLNLCEISEPDMKQISPLVNPQGLIFITKRPSELLFDGMRGENFIVLFDGIRDPGNLGIMIRTAKAVGLKRIFLSEDCADPYSEKVIRAAMAQQFAIEIFYYDNLKTFSQDIISKGCSKIFLTRVSGGMNIFETEDLFKNSAIVFGNEGAGISSSSEGIAVGIPMPGGTESLNVAQAATILLFESVRRGEC